MTCTHQSRLRPRTVARKSTLFRRWSQKNCKWEKLFFLEILAMTEPLARGVLDTQKLGTQKIKNSKFIFLVVLGEKFPNKEKSSSAVCLVLAGNGPILKKTANFGQHWSKWPIFGKFVSKKQVLCVLVAIDPTKTTCNGTSLVYL